MCYVVTRLAKTYDTAGILTWLRVPRYGMLCDAPSTPHTHVSPAYLGHMGSPKKDNAVRGGGGEKVRMALRPVLVNLFVSPVVRALSEGKGEEE